MGLRLSGTSNRNMQQSTMYDFAAISCPLLSKMYHVQETCAMTSRIAMKYYVMPV